MCFFCYNLATLFELLSRLPQDYSRQSYKHSTSREQGLKVIHYFLLIKIPLVKAKLAMREKKAQDYC